jgi:transposase-like protein
MDGLTGFPDAVRAVFPDSLVQRCIIHMVGNSTKYVSYKDLKKVCADLKAVYTTADEMAAREGFEEFGKTWNGKYPMMYRSWDEHWTGLCEYFKYSPRNTLCELYGQRSGCMQRFCRANGTLKRPKGAERI